jgi:hypothetical protein
VHELSCRAESLDGVPLLPRIGLLSRRIPRSYIGVKMCPQIGPASARAWTSFPELRYPDKRGQKSDMAKIRPSGLADGSAFLGSNPANRQPAKARFKAGMRVKTEMIGDPSRTR